MKASKVTWVLVGDASRARLFCASVGEPWSMLDHFEHLPSRQHVHLLVSDRCGSVVQHGGGGTHRTGLAAHTDPHQHEAARFAHKLARRLLQGFSDSKFDEVVLVAPPHFLGLLRGELDDNVKKCLRGTLAKDLSLFAPRAVRARLLGVGIDA